MDHPGIRSVSFRSFGKRIGSEGQSHVISECQSDESNIKQLWLSYALLP